jgi:hypothetical protein
MADNAEALAILEGDHTEKVDISSMAVLNRSELETQIDAAHKHRRSIGRFLQEARALATYNEEVAASCIYTLPRAGKAIVGPSVRLAEMIASAYTNLHVGSRILDAEDAFIVAQGVAWDIEKNVRVTVEVKRRITKKDGKRYDDDMIGVAGAAAASIALRNAIFRVVPRAYVETVYNEARRVAVGDAKTIGTKRLSIMAGFARLGVTADRVLAKVGKASIDDLGFEELEVLVGIGVAIKNNESRIEDYFPEPAPAPANGAPATAKDLEEKIRRPKGKAASAPTEYPAVLLCAVCNEPVTEGLSTLKADGTAGIRHKDCSPITGAAAQADAEPPAHVKTEVMREREPGEEG